MAMIIQVVLLKDRVPCRVTNLAVTRAVVHRLTANDAVSRVRVVGVIVRTVVQRWGHALFILHLQEFVWLHHTTLSNLQLLVSQSKEIMLEFS